MTWDKKTVYMKGLVACPMAIFIPQERFTKDCGAVFSGTGAGDAVDDVAVKGA